MVNYICGNGNVKQQVLSGAVLSSGIGCVVDAIFADDTTSLFMLNQFVNEQLIPNMTLNLMCKVLTSLLKPVQSKVCSLIVWHVTDTQEFSIAKTVDGFIEGLMKYLDNYSVCDYIMALIKLDVFHQNSGSIRWFCENKFVSMLLQVFLEETISIDKVESVSRIINEIVIWKHSHQIGTAANVLVDFFNTDKDLERFIECVFSTVCILKRAVDC